MLYRRPPIIAPTETRSQLRGAAAKSRQQRRVKLKRRDRLARARTKAQSIQCASNRKQIGLANFMCANDHGKTLPYNLAGNL